MPISLKYNTMEYTHGEAVTLDVSPVWPGEPPGGVG